MSDHCQNATKQFSLLTLTIAAIASFAACPAKAQGDKTPTSAPMSFTGGAITLKVANYDEARQKVLEAAQREGAELIDAKTNVTENGRRHGWVRLRFPAERMPVLLGQVRMNGTLYAEKVSTTDNASEYDSLERRVGRLKEHQGRLSGVLNGDRRLRGSDILYVQERLFRAGVDESELLQRRADMERRKTTSTLMVQFFEPVPLRKMESARLDFAAHFASAQNNAFGAMSRFAGRIVTALAYALVWTPLWLPLVILLFVLVRKLWRAAVRGGLVQFIRGAVHQVRQMIATARAARALKTETAASEAPTS
jgi:hypothetical protein